MRGKNPKLRLYGPRAVLIRAAMTRGNGRLAIVSREKDGVREVGVVDFRGADIHAFSEHGKVIENLCIVGTLRRMSRMPGDPTNFEVYAVTLLGRHEYEDLERRCSKVDMRDAKRAAHG